MWNLEFSWFFLSFAVSSLLHAFFLSLLHAFFDRPGSSLLSPCSSHHGTEHSYLQSPKSNASHLRSRSTTGGPCLRTAIVNIQAGHWKFWPPPGISQEPDTEKEVLTLEEGFMAESGIAGVKYVSSSSSFWVVKCCDFSGFSNGYLCPLLSAPFYMLFLALA